MSTLLVEVCEIKSIEKHPSADRLAFAIVKGWQVCVRFDPSTGKAEFAPGEKCIYFPPDSILPLELAEDRLNIMKYLAPLPQDENGVRQLGGRVKATRLRGEASFGVIMKIDPKYGDDPNWEVGTNVQEHFKVKKWEPPATCEDLDAAIESAKFFRYTHIKHWNNFPDVLKEGEEVVVSEKLHGANLRLSLLLEPDENGESNWVKAAGSHDIKRKEFYPKVRKFRWDVIVGSVTDELELNDTFEFSNQVYRVVDIYDVTKTDLATNEKSTEKFIKTHYMDDSNEPVMVKSEFWIPMDLPCIQKLLYYLRDEYEFLEPKFSIIVYGELVGGQKNMQYGLDNKQFYAFDISINGRYLDYVEQERLFKMFDVPLAPILFRGAYKPEVVRELTDGYTTLTDLEKVKGFNGREGVVIRPVQERYEDGVGRVILKSVSVDYLKRNDIGDGH